MQIFAGLGNPGAQYAGNRHNIGFMALDRIAAEHGFPPWRSKFQAQVTEGRLGADKVLLLKPQTYMNRSGQALGEAARFYKLGPEDVTVFHDELDLAPGKCKVKRGGGHAGHNGLRSIHAHLGEAYGRVRLGIGHPGRKELVAAYVLHDFARADEDWLDDLMRGIADGAPDLADGDTGRFMNAVALRTAPPRSSTGTRRPDADADGAGTGAPRPDGEAAAQRGADAPADGAEPGATGPDAEGSGTAPDGNDRSPLQRLVDKFR